MKFLEVGKKYFFRAVTYHTVGELVAIDKNWVRLKDSSWIAESEEYSKTIQEGIVRESEIVGDCMINLDTVVDIFEWKNDLPPKKRKTR
ncbi:MAG: hypothetical protein GY756_09905 [bacterium]|nr:hypothetical protein [bacterium]